MLDSCLLFFAGLAGVEVTNKWAIMRNAKKNARQKGLMILCEVNGALDLSVRMTSPLHGYTLVRCAGDRFSP